MILTNKFFSCYEVIPAIAVSFTEIFNETTQTMPESNYWFSIDSLRCSIFEDLRESKEAY